MTNNKLVKMNISGAQVIKTLQVLLQGHYTMSELIEILNKNENEPVFNNSVVSKYINTCRFLGFSIPKIHNKYFLAKLPFSLNLELRDLELLEKLQKLAVRKLTSKPNKTFNDFIEKLNKYSNKDIIKVEQKTLEMTKELFDKAIHEKRRVCLMYKVKAEVECVPLGIVEYKGKTCFKVLHKDKERHIAVNRISGLELLGKFFSLDDSSETQVVFKLTGGLAQRYTLREYEQLMSADLPHYIKVSNVGEEKSELLSRLLRYDKDCEIISPRNYREEMKLIINSMLENYGE